MSHNPNAPRDTINPPRPFRPKARRTTASFVPSPPPRRRPPQPSAPVTPPDTPPSLNGGAAEPVVSTSEKPRLGKVKRQPTGDYPVGNCRPPKSGQIKPGEVRNPRGRPRGAIGFNTVVRKTMTARVIVRTAAGEQRMTRLEASFIKLADKGFTGSVPALREVFSAYTRAVPEQPTEDPAAQQASLVEDEAILAAFREMFTIGEEVPEPAEPTSEADDDLANGDDDDDT